MRLNRNRAKFLADIRGRMIAETEVALSYGLCFPERMHRIPTMEVGMGRSHPEFAARFREKAVGIPAADEDSDRHSRIFHL